MIITLGIYWVLFSALTNWVDESSWYLRRLWSSVVQEVALGPRSPPFEGGRSHSVQARLLIPTSGAMNGGTRCLAYTLAGPGALGVGPPRRRVGFKVYVLTSWCKWVQYPAPRPSPQPLHRRAICAAKSGNSAPRTKHLENQLDLFLHGRAECQTTQGFLAHNVFLRHLIFYFRFFFFFPGKKKKRTEESGAVLDRVIIRLLFRAVWHFSFRLTNLI